MDILIEHKFSLSFVVQLGLKYQYQVSTSVHQIIIAAQIIWLKYVNIGILCLTPSWIWKLIPKADLKWEGPYFYSFFFKVSVNILKSKRRNKDFPLYFQKVIWPGKGLFLTKKNYENPNTQEYAKVLVVTCRKLEFWLVPLKDPPNI